MFLETFEQFKDYFFISLQNYPTNRNRRLVNRDTIVSTYDFFSSIVCLILVSEAIIHLEVAR